MIKDFKQFVPSSVCLTCDGCCRFKEADSRWRPYVSQGEIKEAVHPRLLDKIFGKQIVGPDHRINATPCSHGFLCHYFNPSDHTCGVYHARPFECQLYPFLLGREGDKAVLYAHLNCPHVQEHWNDQSYKEYCQYLQASFQRQDVKDYLKNNPSVMTDYSSFRNELDLVCAISLE